MPLRLALQRSRIEAALFDMDGVLVSTRPLHEAAWRDALEPLLSKNGEAPLSPSDYRAHIDGRDRRCGLRAFLQARQLVLTEDAMAEVAAAKNELYRAALAAAGAAPLPGVLRLLDCARATGLHLGVVTASRNAGAVLTAAGLTAAFDVVVDGVVASREGYCGKPASDTLLACAAWLRTSPPRCAVFEDATAGIAAARAGGFGVIIGVGVGEQAARLRTAGAHAVVASALDVRIAS